MLIHWPYFDNCGNPIFFLSHLHLNPLRSCIRGSCYVLERRLKKIFSQKRGTDVLILKPVRWRPDKAGRRFVTSYNFIKKKLVAREFICGSCSVWKLYSHGRDLRRTRRCNTNIHISHHTDKKERARVTQFIKRTHYVIILGHVSRWHACRMSTCYLYVGCFYNTTFFFYHTASADNIKLILVSYTSF